MSEGDDAIDDGSEDEGVSKGSVRMRVRVR